MEKSSVILFQWEEQTGLRGNETSRSRGKTNEGHAYGIECENRTRATLVKNESSQQSYFLYYNMTKLVTKPHSVVDFFFFQNIIRDSKIIQGEMAHQLYVYQSLSFSPLVDMVSMRGNASNQVRYRIVVSLTESKGICCGCSGPCYQANFTVLLIQGSN